MKKLLLLCSLTLIFSFMGVFGDTGTYDIDYVDGVGYNIYSGERDTAGYFSITNKMKIVSDTITLNNLDNFHYIVYFNKNNQVIGIAENGTKRALSPNTDLRLDEIESTTVTPPEEAYSFSFQNFNYETYVQDIIDSWNPEEYTITTDQTYTINDLYDTVYTANGVEYSLYDLFGDDYSIYGGINNELTNGDFSTSSTSDWIDLNGAVINNNRLEYIDNGVNVWAFETDIDTYNTNNYYVAFDVVENNIDIRLWFNSILLMYSNLEAGKTMRASYELNDALWSLLSGSSITNFTNNGFMFYSLLGFESWNVAVDNIVFYDLTEMTEAGYEPTGEMIEELLRVWELFNFSPTIEDLLGIIPSYDYNCSTESNPWQGIFDTNGEYIHACYTNGYIVNGFEWESATDIYNIGQITRINEIFKSGESMFYSTYMQLDDEPRTIDLKIGLNGEAFYYDSMEALNQLNTPFETPADINHFLMGKVDNIGELDAEFNIDYNYFIPAGSSTDINMLYLWVFNPYKVFKDYNITEDEIYNKLREIQSPLRMNPNYDSSYFEGAKALMLSYYMVSGLGFDESLDGSAFESITVSYDYTPVTYDRDVDTDIDDYLDNVGLNDSQSKFIIGVSIIVIVTIILGLTTQSGAIILLGDVILYLMFTFLGWFPSWVAILIGLALVLVFGVSLSRKGGDSVD